MKSKITAGICLMLTLVIICVSFMGCGAQSHTQLPGGTKQTEEDQEPTQASVGGTAEDPAGSTKPKTEPSEPTQGPEPSVPATTAHMHSYKETVVAATCSTKGYTHHVCACGDSYDDSETEVLAHDYIATVIPPTCTSEGFTDHVCSLCGVSYTDSVTAALEHNYVATVVPPSCGNEGYTDHVCALCGTSYTDSITEALEHNYVATVVPPTCANEGYTNHVCSLCGSAYADEKVDVLPHTWGEWDYSWEPNIDRECVVCGDIEFDSSLLKFDVMLEAMDTGVYPENMNEHAKNALIIIRQVYDSLPEDADDFDKICAAANWLYENCEYDYDALEIPHKNKAHSYVGAFEYGKAVCAGYAEAFWLFMSMYRIECEYLTGTADNGVEPGLHAWNRVLLEGNWYYVDTTWGPRYFMLSEEEIGKDHFSEDTGYCTQSLPVKFLQRMYNVKDEDVLEDPSKYREKVREDILAGKTELAYLVHSDTHEIVYPLGLLTAEEKPQYKLTWYDYERREIMRSGYILYTFVACHTHNYSEQVVAPNCLEGGYTIHTCVCGHSYIDNETAVLEHSFSSDPIVDPPTCTEDGFTYYLCSVCGDVYIESETAALGHTYDSTVVFPTCTEEGFTRHICSVCTDIYIDSKTAALGHTYDSTVVPPTCTNEGHILHACSVCGDSYIDDVVAAIGHSWSDWTITEEATYYTQGSQERTCAACGEVESQQLDKIPMTNEMKQQDLLRLVNIEREKAGLAPLVYFTEAQAAADVRAEELTVHFGYDRPNGAPNYSVFAEVGLTDVNNVYQNILRDCDDPMAALESCLNAQSFRENILNPISVKLVVGICGDHWVMLFAS